MRETYWAMKQLQKCFPMFTGKTGQEIMGRNCRVALCTSSALSQQGTWVSLFFILLMKPRSTVSFCKSVWQGTPKQKGPSTSAFFNPLMKTAQVWSELAQRSILWLTEQHHTQLFAAKSLIVVLKGSVCISCDKCYWTDPWYLPRKNCTFILKK